MKIDRSKLDGLHFVKSLPDHTSHARIPTEFLAREMNAVAALAYIVMRSKPPTHRWKTDSLALELKKKGIGRGQVEKAMSFLNKEGWIRYVDLLDPRGRSAGTIVEVFGEQLPEVLRTKRPKLVFTESGGYSIYDPSGAIISMQEFNKGRDGGRTSKSLLPHPRDPKERLLGEEYKVNEIEIPLNPHLKNGDTNFISLSEISIHPGDDSSGLPPGMHSPSQSSVSSIESPGFDVKELRRLVEMAKDGNSWHSVPIYEEYLRGIVFPRLENPPPRSRWHRLDCIDWCRTSTKGQVFLAFSNEKEWTADLARKFVRNAGRFSIESMKKVLLSREWMSKLRTLPDLLKAVNQSDETANNWECLENLSKQFISKFRSDLLWSMEQFSEKPSKSLVKEVESLRESLQSAFERGSGFPYAYSERGFAEVWYSFFRAQHDPNASQHWEELKGCQEEWVESVVKGIAMNEGSLVFAYAYRDVLPNMIGCEWERIRKLNEDWLKILNDHAEMLGISRRVSSNLAFLELAVKRNGMKIVFADNAGGFVG